MRFEEHREAKTGTLLVFHDAGRPVAGVTERQQMAARPRCLR